MTQIRSSTRLTTGNARSAAINVGRIIHVQPFSPQTIGEEPSILEILGICTDHRKILSTAQKEAFNERQNPVHIKSVKTAETPTGRIRCLDHGKDTAGLQDASNLLSESRQLRSIEGFQPKGRNHKIRSTRGQFAVKNIGLKMLNPIRSACMKPTHGVQMHNRGYVDRFDMGDIRKVFEKMRPNLSGSRHKVKADRAIRLFQRQSSHALPAPSPDKTKGPHCAPDAIVRSTSVKNIPNERWVINVLWLISHMLPIMSQSLVPLSALASKPIRRPQHAL